MVVIWGRYKLTVYLYASVSTDSPGLHKWRALIMAAIPSIPSHSFLLLSLLSLCL